MQPDFTSTNHGSIITLTALTPAALDWCDDNLCGEELSAHFATIDIEPRYFMDIACGILNDGLRLMDQSAGQMAELPEGY